MPIPTHYDNLFLDRRTVAAYFHGTLDGLLSELHRAGHKEVKLTDLEARAEVLTEMWRIGDPDKGTCYLCNARVPLGTLCRCYDSVIVKRHYNANEPKILQHLHPETVVETFLCQGCHEPILVTAATAMHAHKRHKAYKPHKLCRECYFASRTPKEKAAKPSATDTLMAQASESVTAAQA